MFFTAFSANFRDFCITLKKSKKSISLHKMWYLPVGETLSMANLLGFRLSDDILDFQKNKRVIGLL